MLVVRVHFLDDGFLQRGGVHGAAHLAQFLERGDDVFPNGNPAADAAHAVLFAGKAHGFLAGLGVFARDDDAVDGVGHEDNRHEVLFRLFLVAVEQAGQGLGEALGVHHHAVDLVARQDVVFLLQHAQVVDIAQGESAVCGDDDNLVALEVDRHVIVLVERYGSALAEVFDEVVAEGVVVFVERQRELDDFLVVGRRLGTALAFFRAVEGQEALCGVVYFLDEAFALFGRAAVGVPQLVEYVDVDQAQVGVLLGVFVQLGTRLLDAGLQRHFLQGGEVHLLGQCAEGSVGSPHGFHDVGPQAGGVFFLVFLVLEEALHGVAHLARVVLFDDFALHVVFFGVAQLALVFGLFLHTVSELLIHSHQGLHAVGVEKRQHVYNLGQQFDGIAVGRDGGHQRELLAFGVGKAAERLGRGVGHGIAQPADVVPVAADVLQLGGQVFVEVGGAFVNLLLVLVDAFLTLGRKHLDVFVHFDDGQFAQFPAAEQVVLDAAANLFGESAELRLVVCIEFLHAAAPVHAVEEACAQLVELFVPFFLGTFGLHVLLVAVHVDFPALDDGFPVGDVLLDGGERFAQGQVFLAQQVALQLAAFLHEFHIVFADHVFRTLDVSAGIVPQAVEHLHGCLTGQVVGSVLDDLRLGVFDTLHAKGHELAAVDRFAHFVGFGQEAVVLVRLQACHLPAVHRRNDNLLEQEVAHDVREDFVQVHFLAGFVDIRIEVGHVEGVLSFQQTAHVAVFIGISLDVGRQIASH